MGAPVQKPLMSCDEICAMNRNGELFFPNTPDCLRDCAAADAGTGTGIETCKKEYCSMADGTPLSNSKECMRLCLVQINQPAPAISEAAGIGGTSFYDYACKTLCAYYSPKLDCDKQCTAGAAGFAPASEVTDNSTTTSPTPASVPAASASQKMTYGIATVCVAFFMAMAM